MKKEATKLLAIAIVVAEIASVGMTTTASARDATKEQRQIERQQRLILQQQRQIQQLQQERLGRQGAAAAPPQNLNRGLLGNLGGCPVGYTYDLLYGCLPHVIVN